MNENNNYEKMKCIWMSSMVIDYKLCDNQFNCENCLFDKVMRNLLDESDAGPEADTNIVDSIQKKLQCIKFEDRLIYLKNFFIVKAICQDTFYLGINPILLCFLDDSSSLEINGCGEEIIMGQQFTHIRGTWGSLNFTAPENFIIHDRICDPGESPWKSRWIAIIGSEDNKITRRRISKAEWEATHQRAVNIICDVKRRMNKAGDTMFDGGSRVLSLHQLVGSKKYLSILKSVTA